MKTQFKKRALAVLLTVCMALSLLPATVLAAEDPPQVSGGGTLQFVKELTEGEKADYTINLDTWAPKVASTYTFTIGKTGFDVAVGAGDDAAAIAKKLADAIGNNLTYGDDDDTYVVDNPSSGTTVTLKAEKAATTSLKDETVAVQNKSTADVIGSAGNLTVTGPQETVGESDNAEYTIPLAGLCSSLGGQKAEGAGKLTLTIGSYTLTTDYAKDDTAELIASKFADAYSGQEIKGNENGGSALFKLGLV